MTEFKNQWVIIGISGVTCGGKTSLANQLKETLAPVYVFHQDKYFYPDDSPKHVKCKDLEHNNYDIVSALDMRLMYEHVSRTMDGEDCSHGAALDTEGRYHVQGKKFLIVEGFTVLNYKPLMELCDLRYYLVLEYGECALRRSFRLYSPPDVAGYFDACVWPEHVRYRAEIERDARVVMLDGSQRDASDVVLRDLHRLTDTRHI